MKTNQQAGKTPQPETDIQAVTWTNVQRAYLQAGLCQRCASQAAHGHQEGSGGWSLIEPPCVGCVGTKLPEWLLTRQGDRGQRWLLAEYASGQVKPSKWAPGGEYWALENPAGGIQLPEDARDDAESQIQKRFRPPQPKPVTLQRPIGTIWHPKCGKSWTGTKAEHCPVCCLTFSGPTAGDKHRKGPHEARYCALPESVGLVYDEIRDLWRLPGTWKPGA